MSTIQDNVSQILNKFASDVQLGKYGQGDSFDAAGFWQDWDELQGEIEMHARDPNAQ